MIREETQTDHHLLVEEEDPGEFHLTVIHPPDCFCILHHPSKSEAKEEMMNFGEVVVQQRPLCPIWWLEHAHGVSTAADGGNLHDPEYNPNDEDWLKLLTKLQEHADSGEPMPITFYSMESQDYWGEYDWDYHWEAK